MKNKQKLFLFLALSVLIVIGLQAWDDEKLFTTIIGGKGKSNVILIQDHTGSMTRDHLPSRFQRQRLDVVHAYTETLFSRRHHQTSWYIRWFTETNPTKTINTNITYAMGHTFTSTGDTTGTLLVGSEGINIKVGDWILQYDPSDTEQHHPSGHSAG